MPIQYGVMLANDAGIVVARAALHRAMSLPFATWMALARWGSDRFDRPAQALLGADDCDDLPVEVAPAASDGVASPQP